MTDQEPATAALPHCERHAEFQEDCEDCQAVAFDSWEFTE